MGKERNPVTIRRAKQNIPVCSPSYTAGLDAEAVRLRHLCGLTNTPVESPTKTEGQIIREKCLTFFNLIFVVLAVLLMLVGSFGDMLFLGIAIANTAIGIFQEIRSKRTIDKLTLMNARKVPTTRDGKKILVPSDQLVRDDIVEFAAGDQICADAVVRIGQLQGGFAHDVGMGHFSRIRPDKGDCQPRGALRAGEHRAGLDEHAGFCRHGGAAVCLRPRRQIYIA